MKKLSTILVVLCILAFSAGAVFGMHHAIKIQKKEGIGTYLTDAEGKTLYWFKKDSSGVSACNGPCVDKWPLYYREKVGVPQDLTGEDFGTITREDGKKQTTFRGYPLYYWFDDKEAGESKGQGINNVWFVIDPQNFPPK
jgi:predicted lipoprotein with Yx(FWY)xxD motif